MPDASRSRAIDTTNRRDATGEILGLQPIKVKKGDRKGGARVPQANLVESS
jgi:hypothetical protein